MASATLILDSVPSVSSSPTHGQILKWADLIRGQLQLVAPYDDLDAEYLPACVVLDESIMDVPRRKAADPQVAALAKTIAQVLYLSQENPLGAIIRYEKAIIKLRHLVIKQRKRVIHDATLRKELLDWNLQVIKQGQWNSTTDPLSLNSASILPMPIKIADPKTLGPFFEHLACGGTGNKSTPAQGIAAAEVVKEAYYNVKALDFPKDVLYSDHRMDLCKMVLGPTNISDLIESLRTNEFVTHFLLGNKIIGPYGAQCITEFLREYPNLLDFWSTRWVHSTSVTNIWLKRNPLTSNCADTHFKLITQIPNLRTLDLDQTELGNDGAAELFTKLAQRVPGMTLSLRHFYLNANGTHIKGATAIGEYLACSHCTLDALYLSNNPIDDHAIIALANGLEKNISLTLLTLSSVGMGDDGAATLCGSLMHHPNITVLDLGQHFATQDLGFKNATHPHHLCLTY